MRAPPNAAQAIPKLPTSNGGLKKRGPYYTRPIIFLAQLPSPVILKLLNSPLPDYALQKK
jgi:hypothetical protein